LGLLLLVLPFMVARRTFRVYVELTEAYTSTVRTLVAAIEAKDPYTRGHSERVADYAHRLAEYMGLPKNEVDRVERAALLHDVGKIGISLETLVSPKRLTPDEVNAIRQHPALGSDLVADVEFLSDIVDVVRHHHERCDGAGYPGWAYGGAHFCAGAHPRSRRRIRCHDIGSGVPPAHDVSPGARGTTPCCGVAA